MKLRAHKSTPSVLEGLDSFYFRWSEIGFVCPDSTIKGEVFYSSGRTLPTTQVYNRYLWAGKVDLLVILQEKA